MKQEKNNTKKRTIIIVGILLLLCVGIGTATLLGGMSHQQAPENIENNDTPLAGPSANVTGGTPESIASTDIPGAAPAQSQEVLPEASQAAPSGTGQLVAAPVSSLEAAPVLPVASTEATPVVPKESQEVAPSTPIESEPAPSAPAESVEPSAPAEGEQPAPSKSSIGAKWLYEQLFKEGSTIHNYFATRNSDSKVSLDSEGKNFAPIVKEQMAAEGITGSWRVYANSVKKGEYNVFFTEAEIAEMEVNEKIDNVTKISNYETPGEVVEQAGSATVAERTVEGKTFNTIGGGSFEADPEPVVEEAQEAPVSPEVPEE